MKAKLLKLGFDVPCDIYTCFNRAEYSIGNPEGPMNLNKNICKECKESLGESILGDKFQELDAVEPKEVIKEVVKHEVIVISEDMKKQSVVELAESLNVEFDPKDTRLEIIEKIKEKVGETNE